MGKKVSITLGAIIAFFVFASSAFSQSNVPDAMLLRGYEAYRNKDWATALIVFREAVSIPSNYTEENWFMLIMSEIFAKSYDAVIDDSARFVKQFPSSSYMGYVLYQRGRAYYYLGKSNDAVLQLTEFCHLYPDHSFYPSALFWIAESFFAENNFDYAQSLYERIVSSFPTDPKVAVAQYRMESIAQRDREAKLLYLLQVTGEEYLATREEYEAMGAQAKASIVPPADPAPTTRPAPSAATPQERSARPAREPQAESGAAPNRPATGATPSAGANRPAAGATPSAGANRPAASAASASGTARPAPGVTSADTAAQRRAQQLREQQSSTGGPQ